MTRFLEPARAAHAFALRGVGEGESLRGYRGDPPESLLGRWYRCARHLECLCLRGFDDELRAINAACCTRRSARSSSTSSRRSRARSSSRSARNAQRSVVFVVIIAVEHPADAFAPVATRRRTSRSSASWPKRFLRSTTSAPRSRSSSSRCSTLRSPSRACRSSTRSSRTSKAAGG